MWYMYTDEVCSLMLHPHSWVRLSSAQLLGLLFASCAPADLVAEVAGEGSGGRGLRKRKKPRASEVVVETRGAHYLAMDTLNKVKRFYQCSSQESDSGGLTTYL